MFSLIKVEEHGSPFNNVFLLDVVIVVSMRLMKKK